jgi:hypothetical protein
MERKNRKEKEGKKERRQVGRKEAYFIAENQGTFPLRTAFKLSFANL